MFLLGITGCSDNGVGKNNFSPPTKNYQLDECIVQINIKWDDKSLQSRQIFIDQALTNIMVAIQSGKFPRFTANTIFNQDIVFYFSDRCDERKLLVEKIISLYLIKDVDNFPKYILLTPTSDDIKGKSNSIPLNDWWKE